MTEGHPAFVANNGRIGFGLDDYAAFATEAGEPVRLHWLAARRTVTRLTLGRGQTEEGLYDGERRRRPANGSPPGCGLSGSIRPTTCSCRCTRGSGSTSWP